MNSRINEIQNILNNLSFPEAWDKYYLDAEDAESTYNATVELFKDYCGYNFNAATMLFSKHHHNDVMRIFLLNQRSQPENEDVENITTAEFLRRLELQLRKSARVLNPAGSLVKRIAYVQQFIQQDVINLNQLCQDLSGELLGRKDIETELILQMETQIRESMVDDEIDPQEEVFPPFWDSFFDNENDDFITCVIAFFKDYCCYDWYFYNVAAFFKGKSAHHHNDVVRRVIDSAINDPQIENPVVKFLLLLEKELKLENKILNPKGSLARRIRFIQSALEEKPIDMEALCNYLSEREIQLRSSGIVLNEEAPKNIFYV